MRQHDKRGRIKPALSETDKEIVQKWIKSGITGERELTAKIYLHFNVAFNTAKFYANKALK